jgi:hypothetical protein
MRPDTVRLLEFVSEVTGFAPFGDLFCKSSYRDRAIALVERLLVSCTLVVNLETISIFEAPGCANFVRPGRLQIAPSLRRAD